MKSITGQAQNMISDVPNEYDDSDTEYDDSDSESDDFDINNDNLAYVDSTLLCPLSRYILAKDKNTVKRLLRKRKKNPTQLRADSRGWTALHVAAFNDEHADFLKLLLSNKDTVRLNLDAKTGNGKTALYLACYKGCVKNCRILLESQCNPDIPDIYGFTPLHVASRYGHVDIVSQLIARGVNSNYVCSNYGNTALHSACQAGNVEVIRALMRSKETKVSIQNMEGHLPLHVVCKNGSVEILKTLLEADRYLVDVCDNRSRTPLEVAIQNRHLECVQYLLDQGATANCFSWDRSTLSMAARIGDAKILSSVLKATSPMYIREQFMIQTQDTLSNCGGEFKSLMSAVIDCHSPECMSLLLQSDIPKGIVEAPLLLNAFNFLVVESPLAYLFNVVTWRSYTQEEFDEMLQLLLKNHVTHMYEFTQMVEWKAAHTLNILYGHPFTYIFGGAFSSGDPFPPKDCDHYLNMLFEYGITTDYCLQLEVHYKGNFLDFDVNVLERFYEPVVWAVKEDQAEFIELLLVNSAILEPSHVWNFLQYRISVMMARESPQNVVNYLIDLGVIVNTSNVPLYPFGGIIKYPNLQQLCRQAIRKHLRDVTVEDNLKNFKEKINALPLPNLLKDYLHFKIR